MKLFTYSLILLLCVAYYTTISQTKSIEEAGKILLESIQKDDFKKLESIRVGFDIYRKLAPTQFQERTDEEIGETLNQGPYSLPEKFAYIPLSLNVAGLDRTKLKFKSAKEKKFEFLKMDWVPVNVIFEYEGITDTIMIELYQDKGKWFFVDFANDDRELLNIISKKSKVKPDVFVTAGMEFRNSFHPGRAAYLHELAAKLDPSSSRNWYDLGISYIIIDDLRGANQSLEKALGLATDDSLKANTYTELGYIEMKIGKKKEAIDYFNKALKLYNELYYPNSYIAMLAFDDGDYSTASQYLRKVLSISVEEGYYTYYLLALSHMQLKEYRQALENYLEALKRDPGNQNMLYDIAWLYNELEDFEQAVVFLNSIINDDSNNYDAIYELGYAYKNLKQYRKAIDCFVKVEAELDNGNTYSINRGRLCNHLGESYYLVGNFSKACNYLQCAQEFGFTIDDKVMEKACGQ